MKLYDMTLSGNAFKVRLMLSLLDIDYESVPVDLASGANREVDHLARNPRGQVPVLEDDDDMIWESQAILWHLALRSSRFLPTSPLGQVQTLQWLGVAGNECLFGLSRARAVKLFNRPFDLAQCQQYGRSGLSLIDQHLSEREWLANGEITIADIACYPYVALAEEGEISLAPYDNVRAWMGRVQALPGYVAMPGLCMVG